MMDNKLIFGMFVILFILPSATAISSKDLKDYDYVGTSIFLEQGYSYEMVFNINDNFDIIYPEDNILLSFVSRENETVESSSTILYTCLSDTATPNSGTLRLSQFLFINNTPTFRDLIDLGAAAIYKRQFVSLKLLTVPANLQSLTTTPIYDAASDETNNLKLGQKCFFTAVGQDMYLDVVALPRSDRSINAVFYVPNEMTGELVNNVEESLNSGFDVIRLILIATGLLLLLFIIIFAYKLLVYFVNQVRGNKEDEQQ